MEGERSNAGLWQPLGKAVQADLTGAPAAGGSWGTRILLG